MRPGKTFGLPAENNLVQRVQREKNFMGEHLQTLGHDHASLRYIGEGLVTCTHSCSKQLRGALFQQPSESVMSPDVAQFSSSRLDDQARRRLLLSRALLDYDLPPVKTGLQRLGLRRRLTADGTYGEWGHLPTDEIWKLDGRQYRSYGFPWYVPKQYRLLSPSQYQLYLDRYQHKWIAAFEAFLLRLLPLPRGRIPRPRAVELRPRGRPPKQSLEEKRALLVQVQRLEEECNITRSQALRRIFFPAGASEREIRAFNKRELPKLLTQLNRSEKLLTKKGG